MMQSNNLPKVQECLGANHFPTFRSLGSAQPASLLLPLQDLTNATPISSTFWLFNFFTHNWVSPHLWQCQQKLSWGHFSRSKPFWRWCSPSFPSFHNWCNSPLPKTRPLCNLTWFWVLWIPHSSRCLTASKSRWDTLADRCCNLFMWSHRHLLWGTPRDRADSSPKLPCTTLMPLYMPNCKRWIEAREHAPRVSICQRGR